MNTGIDKDQEIKDLFKYIDFLSITRAELYYYCIEPIGQILNNQELPNDNKIKEMKLIHIDFMKRMNNWNIEDYGFKI